MKPITRRDMLSQASLLGTAVVAALPLGQTGAAPASHSAKSKIKVVVTGGHPGDPEYACGGTVAHYSDMGHEVVLLYLNRGEWTDKPSYDPAPVRVAEAKKACAILKARPVFAGQIDGKAIVDPAHYEEFHRLLEAEQPDVVFTHWPIDNHPDHRAISILVYEAWLRMGKKFALYYYEVSNGEDTVQFSPTHYVDITSTESRKRSACYAHASQAPDKFYALQQLVTRMRGIESGHPQAEAYIRHVQSPDFTLPTGESK
ncbi:MAG TPA: PIG-L family deacetylase [Verrucomicrobiae bacterium]|nr:PIG-L family deacetylase [Verrucomicrobiae bacterium]